ncbi:MAG: RNA polymerase sporulation sigma factor SigH [Eubacteriaceae bacterium]
MDNEQFTQKEIVEKAQAGDKEAELYILQKFRKDVLRKARSYFLVGGDHEDLIQEGMIGLLKAIWDYRSDRDAGFGTFANLCIERQIQMAINTANRQKHMPLNNSVSIYTPISDKDTEVSIIDQLPEKTNEEPSAKLIMEEELKHLLNEVRRELSDFEKKVLSYYIQGASYCEISQALSCSNKSVDNALQRVKKKLFLK